MTILHKQHGHSLIETLLSAIIGALLCIYCTHFLLQVLQVYTKIQHKFNFQHAKLIAKHYITTDLYANTHGIGIEQNLKTPSDVLIIYGLDWRIMYYLRKTTLYRDDIKHNAIALVEGIKDFKIFVIPVSLFADKVIANVIFVNGHKLEIICILNKHH